MKIEKELMRGAGPLAVMKQLSRGEMYGYQLVKALSRQSGGLLEMGQSTLYPMLYNLEAKGLVASRTEDGPSGNPDYSQRVEINQHSRALVFHAKQIT